MVASDVIIIGAGHNGLVAALFLARRGLSVLVVDEQDMVGGAVRTERPFAKAPDLAISSGAHLLGLMPPELLRRMAVDIPLRRRDPHAFVPTTGNKFLMLGSDPAETRRQLTSFFSEADASANEALQAEIAEVREDLARSWLAEPLSVEGTAERYLRPALREIFVDLCRKSVGDYIERFGFQSDLLKAMHATAGTMGLYGTWNTPGSGMNFLVHNMCRLPGAGGTWMAVEGGMGTLTQRIADAARRAGAVIHTGKKVQQIVVHGNVAKGVVLEDGTELHGGVVACNADPFRMRDLVGAPQLPAEYNKRLDAYRRDGTTMKVNLALKGLPKFTCTTSPKVYGATIHVLPGEKDVMASLVDGFEAMKAGKLPERPALEWQIDATATGGVYGSSLLVPSVPYALEGTTWEAAEDRYVKHLLAMCDRFAPGTSELIVEYAALHPQKLEAHFGITRGHIHHVDNAFGFADRAPYQTPIAALYSCSAGCHPAGSVIGAAGHNAAMKILEDMELGLEATHSEPKMPSAKRV